MPFLSVSDEYIYGAYLTRNNSPLSESCDSEISYTRGKCENSSNIKPLTLPYPQKSSNRDFSLSCFCMNKSHFLREFKKPFLKLPKHLSHLEKLFPLISVGHLYEQ